MHTIAHHLTCFPPMIPLEAVASQNPQDPGSAHSSFPSSLPGAQLLPNSGGNFCEPECRGDSQQKHSKHPQNNGLRGSSGRGANPQPPGTGRIREPGGNSAACPWLPLLSLAGYSPPAAAAFCSAAPPAVFITRLRACRGCFSSHPALLVLPSIRGAAGGGKEPLPARGPCAAGGCGMSSGCSPRL